MSLSDLDRRAWDACLAAFKPAEQPAAKWASPLDMACALDRSTVRTPALDLINGALVDVAEGRCNRLMISLAPQEGKSLLTSRRFPLWLLTQRPDLRIAIVSYAHNVARRWGRAIRDDIVEHPETGLAIDPGSKAAHEWEIAGRQGSCYAVGVKGSLTARPVDLLIIDDPYKDGEQADSTAWQDTVRDFWTEVAIPRLGPGVAVVIIQTRWRDNDLSGWLQKRDDGVDWRVINIPAQADHDPEAGETDPLGREPGEYLISARGRSVADWEQRKREMGSRAWQALCQGRPSPATGAIFKRAWWRYYTRPLWREKPDGARYGIGFDRIVQSWDMAFKDTSSADYVVGQVWGQRGPDLYLLDQTRARMSFTETCQAVRALSARWPETSAKYVEDKANGTAVMSALRQTMPGLIAVEPDGSKVARAQAVSPFVEAGNIHLPAPELAAWVGDFIEEAAAFPVGAHDDQVDAFTQAANRLLLVAVAAQGGGQVVGWGGEPDPFRTVFGGGSPVDLMNVPL